MACGLRPWISVAFHTIRPAVGVRMPVIRLSSVVLPDPFGPRIPKISPFSMENEISDTAVSPPKRFVTSTSSSSTAPNRKRADHALRHHQDGDDQHETIQHGTRLAGKVDNVRKSGQHESPGDRPDNRGSSSQQDHRDNVERLINAEIVRFDVAGVEGIETAGYGCEGVRQRKRQKLVAENVDAERLREILVETNRRETTADPRAQHQGAEANCEDKSGEAEEVPTHRSLDSQLTNRGQPERGLVEDHQSERAVGHVVPIEDD